MPTLGISWKAESTFTNTLEPFSLLLETRKSNTFNQWETINANSDSVKYNLLCHSFWTASNGKKTVSVNINSLPQKK
jgi:hypothetical protein